MPLWENEFVPPAVPPITTRQKVSEDDATFISAMKNLAPLMADDEREKWRFVIEAPMTIGQQFAAWRARRKNAEEI